MTPAEKMFDTPVKPSVFSPRSQRHQVFLVPDELPFRSDDRLLVFDPVLDTSKLTGSRMVHFCHTPCSSQQVRCRPGVVSVRIAMYSAVFKCARVWLHKVLS